MLTQRTEHLKRSINAMMDAGVRKTTFYTLAAQSLQQTQGQPLQLRRAEAFRYLLEQVALDVHPYELIGGSITGMWPVDPDVPDYETQYAQSVQAVNDFIAHKDDPEPEEEISLRFEVQAARAAGGRFALMARDHFNGNIDFSRLQKINEQLRQQFADDPRVQPSDIVKITEDFFVYDYGQKTMELIDSLPWSAANHVNLNYGKVLRLGYRGILQTVEQKLAQPCTPEQTEFYQAVSITLNSAIHFIHRYAAAYRLAAQDEPDTQRAAELAEIAETLDTVAEEPAASFRQAVQLVWITHLIQSINLGAALSFARFDQYMLPYYRADLQAGRITREDAAELLRHLWLKVNEPKMRTVQSMTLAGITPDGADAANELTALCLEVTSDLKLPYPNVAVRVKEGVTPEWVYDKAVETIQRGFGIPMLVNDDDWIPKFLDFGYPVEYARDYYNMGCVEMMIAGKQADWLSATGGYISYPAVLNQLIEDWCGGNFIPQSYDELYAEYLNRLKARVAVGEAIAKKQIGLIKAHSRDPFASALIDGCIERGKDLFCGGALCPAHIAINGYGLATAADSFMVIRKSIFERRLITIEQLRDAMRDDFCGHEELTALAEREVPRFGNDCDEVDQIAVQLLTFLLDQIYALNDGSFEEKFVTSFFSYTRNVSIGEVTGATPNGRHCGAALSDALGPSQGCDIEGPTRMLNSVAKLPTGRLTGAVATNLKVNPSLFATPAGTLALKTLLKVYLHQGGPQIQVNFVSLEELKAAQKHPEQHRDLVVRIAGYCEYFVNLDVNEQQEIINRTEHEMEGLA